MTHPNYGQWDGGTGRKFGRQHARECTCTDCLRAMERHEAQNNARCVCADCADTRSQLSVIRATEERGRLAQAKGELKAVANISICDRPQCGSMAKSNIVGVVDINTNAGADGRNSTSELIRGQICPACVGEFVTWWEQAVGERERAYTQPWKRATVASEMSSVQLMQLAIEKGREELNDA